MNFIVSTQRYILSVNRLLMINLRLTTMFFIISQGKFISSIQIKPYLSIVCEELSPHIVKKIGKKINAA